LRSDEQLVALFRDGSDDAFRAIHDRYRTRLLAYARQMLRGASSDPEDALQDVFLRAYRALRRSDRPVILRAWLYRIAHNRCIDELRRPHPVPSELDAEAESAFAAPRASGEPAAVMERGAALTRLLADVQSLPSQQRSALLMRELQGLTYEELASALTVSVPAVKSLLLRARTGLVDIAVARDTPCVEIRDELISAADRSVRISGRARRHCSECATCDAYRGELRRVRRGFAALVPAGPLGQLGVLLGLGGGGGAAAAGGGGAVVSGSAFAGATAAKIAVAVCCAALIGTAGPAVLAPSAPRIKTPATTTTPPPVAHEALASAPPAAATTTQPQASVASEPAVQHTLAPTPPHPHHDGGGGPTIVITPAGATGTTGGTSAPSAGDPVTGGVSGFGGSGATGQTGATGVSGDTSSTGPTGAGGTESATGATGTTASTGASGADASGTETGATGASGTTGASTPTGASGTTGASGATGATALAGISGSGAASAPSGVSGAPAPAPTGTTSGGADSAADWRSLDESASGATGSSSSVAPSGSGGTSSPAPAG